MVLEGFLVGFWSIFQTRRAPANVCRRNARNATKPQFLLGFIHIADNARKAKNEATFAKNGEQTHIWGNIDVDSILMGFWVGFGIPNSMIF